MWCCIEQQIGSWYHAIRLLGVPVRLIASARLCSELNFTGVRVLLMQSTAVLPTVDANCVNEWLLGTKGSTLIYRAGVSGMYDEIGQLRTQSAIQSASASRHILDNPGDVLGLAPEATVKALAWVVGSSLTSGKVAWQLAPYSNSSMLLLHGLRFNSSKSSSCPVGHPYMYGSTDAGFYCCSVPASTSCSGSLCCEKPGTKSGCQGNMRCNMSVYFRSSVQDDVGIVPVSLSIPLASVLGHGGSEPKLAHVRMWAPADNSRDDASRAAGLRYWMKDGALIVKMAAAPTYFVLSASL
eukprot:SAG31_NODE_8981_length_1353_cov_1.515949_1_plen_296_part_00